MGTVFDADEIIAPDAAREALWRLNRILAPDSADESTAVDVAVAGSADCVVLPRDVALVLRDVLSNLAAGTSVGVIPMHAELTTQQAADLRSVSRPHVVKLMDSGEIAGRKVGTHRRIYAAALREYKHRRDLATRDAADELVSLTEDLGLYE